MYRGLIAPAGLAFSVLVALSGCLVENDQRGFGAPATGDGRVTMVWDIFVLEETRARTCAAAGAARVEVRAEPLGGRGGPISTWVFACTAAAAEVVLPADHYAFSFALKNSRGQVLSRVTLPDAGMGVVEVRARGATHVNLHFIIQSFLLSWSIEWQDAPGSVVSCAAARAATVRFETMLAGDADAIFYDFPCTDYSGSTPAVPTGSYMVRMWLLDAAGGVLSITDLLSFFASESTRAFLPPVVFGVNRS